MKNIVRPVRGNYQVTYTYADHINYALEHPEIAYNGGIDYYSDNRNIYSCDDGIVDKTGFDAKGYGNYIKLKHDWGYSLYAHLYSPVNFPIGFEVKANTIIGIMGTTGFSTGVHLHFEVRDTNNKFFDGTNYIQSYDENKNIPEVIEKEIQNPIVTESNKIKIICDEANLRLNPGVNGQYLKSIYKDEVYDATGKKVNKDNLIWREIKLEITAWVAEKDGLGTIMVEDI